MDHQPRVQVVLGEAERTDGLLRFVLEAEGFDIVGLASDDEELVRVLRGARPAVVVLDGGISATAALEARERSHGAALVVVWPDGVSAAIAEQRVDPYEAIADLGDAVRRAVHRAELSGQTERREAERRERLIRIPEARDVAPTIVRGVPRVRREPSTPPRSRGRRAQVLVAAATWMLILTALTTIAMAVPNALGLFPGRGGARPASIGSVNRRPSDPRPEDAIAVHERVRDTGGSAACSAATARRDRATRSSGRAHADAVHAQACHSDHGKSKAGKKSTGAGGTHDPVGKANEKQKLHGDRAGDGSPQADGTAGEDRNGGGAGGNAGSGSAGKVKEPPRTGTGGRGEHGNPG
jgi:hypothetical protein